MTTTFTWTGAAYQDWFTPADWSPAGPPTAGSVALIDSSAGPQIDSGETVDNLGIVLGVEDATVALDGGAIGSGVTITAAASGRTYLQVLGTSTFDGNFAFAPTVTNAFLDLYGTAGETLTIGQSGTLTADAGNGIILASITVSNDGTLNAAGGLISVYSGALDGTGVVNISNGGLFLTNKDIGAGETVSFADQTGLLDVYRGATLAGPITNFQPGDVINIGGVVANTASYVPGSHLLEVTAQGTTVASFNLISNGSSLDFATRLGSYGDTVITSSDATRVWNGGTADWYDTSHWTTSPPSPASFPLAGDTVQIGSGVATISPADVLQYGTLDAEDIILAGSSGAAGTLLLRDDTIGPNAIIETTGTKQFGELRIGGSVTLNGVIDSQVHNGSLAIDLANGATLVNGTGGSVLSGTSGGLKIEGTGTFVNNGIVVAQGGLDIGSGVTFTATANGTGSNELVRLQHGGTLTIDGVFENNSIEFGDSTGYLTLANLSGFNAAIYDMTGGDRIDLPNLQVDSVDYSAQDGTLVLNDGSVAVGTLDVYTLDGYSGFTVVPDKHGGSLITYAPTVQVLQPALPVPLVVGSGADESLQDLLIQAFGTVPADYTGATFGLSYMTKQDLYDYTFSYWDLKAETVTEWKVNGTVQPGLPQYAFTPPNPPTTVVQGESLAGITLQGGDAIMPAAILSIPIGENSSVAYYIPTIDPNVASPTIYSGIVNPSDIVASAERFAAYYINVVNSNDCGWIGDDVAAAAGATMPSEDQSTDPTANVAGGFWRIVYRGSDEADPVQNWSVLLEPGDIVRMGWAGGGQHTTTVLGINPDGSILVYDNDDWLPGASKSIIGIHDATYWTETIPASITIYRLDPNHQFLVSGAAAGEYLQGSVYNNLFQPVGGDDTIAAGTGKDEIQGTATNIAGSSVLGLIPGDSIDITNLAVSGATKTYDAATGTLTVSNIFSGIHVNMALPVGLPYSFQLAADASGTGTLVTVACFASGTRLRTAAGDVPVEELAVGDMLLTRAGQRRPIRWIGRRWIDPRRHPKPNDVQPVRIAAHAFGRMQPQRALVLSPDHALYFDDSLIPVRHLIDGEQIVQLTPETVTYWHVELDQHDVILAEGLPVESYLDIGDRSDFANDGGPGRLHPDFASYRWEEAGCAPLTVTGPKLDAARQLVRSMAARRDAA